MEIKISKSLKTHFFAHLSLNMKRSLAKLLVKRTFDSDTSNSVHFLRNSAF